VIQFKEAEITQMMSTMSDGWKFEQIVNVGSHYNYTTDDHSEYLLIVSKEYGINENVNEKEGSDKRKVTFFASLNILSPKRKFYYGFYFF
jgi:BTB/POZ domain-containing protein KCTD2/5/17